MNIAHAITDPRLQDREKIGRLADSITNALGLAVEVAKIKGDVDTKREAAWPAWRDVATVAAEIRLEASELKATIGEMAKAANIKPSTLGSYASIAAGLVPILAMPAEAFDALAKEAKPDGKIAKDCNATDAKLLIRALKARESETSAMYARRLIAVLANGLREGLNVDTKGAKRAQADAARENAAQVVIGKLEACFAAIGEDMPAKRGGQDDADDVLADESAQDTERTGTDG